MADLFVKSCVLGAKLQVLISKVCLKLLIVKQPLWYAP